MDYIKELNAFYEYVKENPLNGITQVLWIKLSHEYYIVNNNLEWVELNDLKLMHILKLKKNSLVKHRRILINSGLLVYEQDVKNKSLGRYKVIGLEDLIKDNRDLSEFRIEDFGCSARLYHRLYDSGIKTVENLVNKTENDIMRIPGIGSKTIEELQELLKVNNLSLRKD